MQDRFIIRQAVYNVWCTPNQDNQFILLLSRLTPPNGVVNRFKFLWDNIPMPESGVWYHLFQLGQVHPTIVNLINQKNQWIKLSDVCNSKSIIIDLYNYNGIKLPTTEIYYFITDSNNILIAFKDLNIAGFNFNTDNVYFRTYKNTYFETKTSDPLNDFIKVEGGLVSSTDFILNLQNKIIALRATNRGIVYCFVNGYKQNDINLVTSKIGDYVEYIYDSSIKTVIDFPLNNLPSFDSIVDNKGKYILHYPGTSTLIDYNDDIEIFLQDNTGKGIYVHKNHRDTLRNITHKDYSIVSSYIENYLSHFTVNGLVNRSNIVIRLHIKKSGYDRPLVLERNRINELYKLPDAKLIQALVGINSNVSVWRADALENSEYVRVMGSEFEDITNDLVTTMYGFDAISKIVADSPVKNFDEYGQKKCFVPYLLSKGCTCFEYDIDGYLLGWCLHTTGDIYVCENDNCINVEMIAGLGGDPDENYTYTNAVVDPNNNYRFYTCGLSGSVYDNNWIDVTGTANYTINADTGIVTWDLVNKLPMVRSDKKFYCKNYSVDFSRGILEIPLQYNRTILSATVIDAMKVPMGEIDVFLNGKSLIEFLDYYFDKSKGSVIIVNKSFINETGLQDVVIRMTGFCDSNLNHNVKGSFGFVQLGRVSDNHRFDIKDGKVQRIIVNGSMRTKEQVSYYDDLGSGTVFNSDNGKPYLIRDVVVPMKYISGRETYQFKNQCDLIDKEISDYMTLYMNQISPPSLNVTSSLHYLYSPFLARLLDDLVSGVIDPVPLQTRFTNEFVTSVCAPYEYLLAFDPISNDNSQPRDYVIVHAHRYNNVVALNLPQYRFLSKVIEIYANGNIEIVNQIRIA